MKAPCLGCPDRTVRPNCHTACEKYRAYEAERVQIREARRLDHDATSALIFWTDRIKQAALRRSKGR